MAQSVCRNPTFVCHSGKLLWGQFHCIVEGHLGNALDAESTLENPSIRGTIIQRDFNYKVNAALGEWSVKDILFRYQPEQSPCLAGFIIYNKEMANPVDILNDCAKLGLSSSQDKRIIYVNRYDWGWAHEIPLESQNLLYDGEISDEVEDKFRNLIAGRIFLADADSGLAVINQLKQISSTTPKNVTIKDPLVVGNDAVGVHLACPHTEYELGWMVFNETNKKELIAFVYDGAYTGLDGDISLGN
ncbi:uncharacterized protein LOC119081354 [Bradysia coprophila]|uniref:uncharacterized protein LOC119081354 n=1 Tax=Bradysia coprophila TaxID=38358 RepID=UPI00187DC445|nr:uncharacterized protein LOC119081354 [Bradysia coprophila]XP_037046097.1 uncharacterized protein LOC119081354 [Bradysia coprophila]XP_037046098.1 uncharacterized protein LOC119081354 [Bradysia coprophila]